MNNSKPKHKSIALNGSQQDRVFRTFGDWQAEQKADLRTPAERGLHVGSTVMWRYQSNQVIITERAIVTAIEHETLTLLVKDVTSRTCNAHISEIVDSQYGSRSIAQSTQRPFIPNQLGVTDDPGAGIGNDVSRSVGSWL